MNDYDECLRNAVWAEKVIKKMSKRIAELEATLVEVRYHADGVIKIQPIYDIANKALSEGGSDEASVCEWTWQKTRRWGDAYYSGCGKAHSRNPYDGSSCVCRKPIHIAEGGTDDR